MNVGMLLLDVASNIMTTTDQKLYITIGFLIIELIHSKQILFFNGGQLWGCSLSSIRQIVPPGLNELQSSFQYRYLSRVHTKLD
jgi:hypothetical protein